MSPLVATTHTPDFVEFPTRSRLDAVQSEGVVLRARSAAIKVLILTDTPLLGWGVQTSLTGWADLSVGVHVTQEADLSEVLAEERPEVVVMATSRVLPSMCRQLRAAQQLGRIGALACLTSSGVNCREQPGHLTLPLAAATPTAMRDLLGRALAEARPAGSAAATPPQALTGRETEIGRLGAAGHSSQAIARQLFISPRTVEKHRANIMAKLGVANAAALTLALVYLLWEDMAQSFAWPEPVETSEPAPVEGERQVA